MAIANILWSLCLGHKRGVGGEAYIARYCVWEKYRGVKQRKRRCFVPIIGLTTAHSRNKQTNIL